MNRAFALRLLPIGLAAISISGCSKPAPSAALPLIQPAPPPASASSPVGTEASSPATHAPPASASQGLDSDASFSSSTEFQDLTKHLEVFLFTENRFPRDINELCAVRRISPVPRPPAGSTLVIDREAKRVKLVSPK